MIVMHQGENQSPKSRFERLSFLFLMFMYQKVIRNKMKKVGEKHKRKDGLLLSRGTVALDTMVKGREDF